MLHTTHWTKKKLLHFRVRARIIWRHKKRLVSCCLLLAIWLLPYVGNKLFAQKLNQKKHTYFYIQTVQTYPSTILRVRILRNKVFRSILSVVAVAIRCQPLRLRPSTMCRLSNRAMSRSRGSWGMISVWLYLFKGWKQACIDNNEIKLGLNVLEGKVT
jgi:hypothetical protein